VVREGGREGGTWGVGSMLTCAGRSVQDDSLGGLDAHLLVILWVCEGQLHGLLVATRKTGGWCWVIHPYIRTSITLTITQKILICIEYNAK